MRFCTTFKLYLTPAEHRSTSEACLLRYRHCWRHPLACGVSTTLCASPCVRALARPLLHQYRDIGYFIDVTTSSILQRRNIAAPQPRAVILLKAQHRAPILRSVLRSCSDDPAARRSCALALVFTHFQQKQCPSQRKVGGFPFHPAQI